MVHKSCLSRARSKYKIVNGHLIECCVDKNNSTTKSANESKLEITLREISEDAHYKSEHIKKLKLEHSKMLEEALKNEEELCAIISSQKEQINCLLTELRLLKEKITLSQKTTVTTSTQTENLKKCSVSTQVSVRVKSNETQTICLARNDENTEGKIQVPVNNSKKVTAHHQDFQIVEQTVQIEKLIHKESVQNCVEGKSRIVLIAGENGRNCGRYLNNLISDRFNINVITKPNAKIPELMNTFTRECKYLNKNDTVVVWFSDIAHSKQDQNALNHGINLSKTCRSIFISQHRYSRPDKRVYRYNNVLWKACVNASKINKVKYFESNDVIKNIHIKQDTLKTKGTILLLRHVVNLIKQGIFPEPNLVSISAEASKDIIERKIDQDQSVSVPINAVIDKARIMNSDKEIYFRKVWEETQSK